jgi:hypothetical protein
VLLSTSGTIIFEGSTADASEIVLTVVDPTADRTITLPNVTGTVITTGDTDTITGSMIADNAIDSQHYAADSIDAEHYAPGSVDATALASNAVTSVKINSAAVTTAKIADANVTTAKIAASAVGASELNVSGNGTTSQFLRSDGDGTMTWAAPTGGVTAISVVNAFANADREVPVKAVTMAGSISGTTLTLTLTRTMSDDGGGG